MKRAGLVWLTVPGLSLCCHLALLGQLSPESNFTAERVIKQSRSPHGNCEIGPREGPQMRLILGRHNFLQLGPNLY